MNYKNASTDSGYYKNGQYYSKNGFTGSGLNCPKGTRVFDPNVIQAIFFEPSDTGASEEFKRITTDVAADILPYYAISNYGRILNTRTGKLIKVCYRPNGYPYVCLAADNCKNGQKKYSVHRMVLETFCPREDAALLQVNHSNGNKTENFINKTMPDGTIKSNLEWVTASENSNHAVKVLNRRKCKLTEEDIIKIREYYKQGYTYQGINNFYPDISNSNIQAICQNKYHYDTNYNPQEKYECSVRHDVDNYNTDVNDSHRLSINDVMYIRNLASTGLTSMQIQSRYFPSFTPETIRKVVTNRSYIE